MMAGSPTSILVRVPNWLGDAVMCEPALRDLRDCFPSAKISMLAKPAVGELLSGHPGCDDMIPYDRMDRHKGWVGLTRLIKSIASKGFDMAVLFQNAFQAAMIAYGAGIPERVGYGTDARGFLLTRRIPLPECSGRHQVQYYRSLVSRAFAPSPVDRQPLLYFRPGEEAVLKAGLSRLFEPADTLFVGINPGSIYGSAKRWLPERFAAVGTRLIQELQRRHGGRRTVRCVIVGGRGEEELGRLIAEQISGEAHVLSGQTSIRELMMVIKHCAVFLTNDTGPMHIARALEVPVVAVFGSTDPEATGPVGHRQGIVRTPVRCAPCLLRACPIDHRCMTGVSVDQVWNVAQAQLSDRPLPDGAFGGPRA